MTRLNAPDPQALGIRLNEILESLGQTPLAAERADRFGAYTALLMRWNARMNLTAVRDFEGILRRHMVESVLCAGRLPEGITTLLDFGSGAGFPGVPIAVCRPEIAVTLGESQGKKAAFLREAARVLGLQVKVFGGRAEALGAQFGCVTLRAVDRMGESVRAAVGLVRTGGWLAVLTTGSYQGAIQGWAGEGFAWESTELPGSEARILLLGRR